ncbi:MAG: NAD(P)-binding domain-containing protein, partial [Deltaproteobacteria bacterium]
MKPEKTPLQEKTIGVAGLGQMGFPMACRIQQAGYQVLGHDIVRKHLDGPIPLEFDPQKFARSCDLVLSVVRDEAQNLELCLGKQAIFKQDQRPEGLIIASTVSPGFILEMKDRLPQETLLVDAPMSGAPIAARERRLSFMLGGDPTVLGRLMPLFDVMGQRIFT